MKNLTSSSQSPTAGANPANPEAQRRLVGLAPVFDARAQLLVLGSFPGAASLQAAQYYAHPRNAFWPVMSVVTGEDLLGLAYADRLLALRRHHIALWDAVAACHREGSLDAAIEAVEPSDLLELVGRLPALRAIACNGALAHRQTLLALGKTDLPVLKLPSTSPAHAGQSLGAKVDAWRAAVQLYLPAAAARL